jgi:hypothetical protein
MEADFLAVCPSVTIAAGICSATPATLGGQMFKYIREISLGYDGTGHVCTGTPAVCYGDMGQYNAWMYQVTGNAEWATRGWTRLDNMLTGAVDNRPFQAAPWQAYKSIVQNTSRELLMRTIRTADWLDPALTAPQRASALSRNAAFAGGAIHHPNGATVGADSDQVVGDYFGTALHYLIHPEDPTVVANFTYTSIGGLDPTPTGSTHRNAILRYLDLASGGEWNESAEYNEHTVTLMLEGYDAVITKSGVDYFPEITAWMPSAANGWALKMKPTRTQTLQWGDTETPRTFLRYQVAGQLMALSGLLHGTVAGQRTLGLYQELVDLYGLAGYQSMSLLNTFSAPFIFFDPYDTQLDWRSSISYTFTGARLALRNSHISDPLASQFQAYYGGPIKYNPATNNVNGVQHQGSQFGDWELWRNGAWAITHPKDYDGPSVQAGDGNNSPMAFGYAAMKNFNGAWHAIHDTLYTYVTGTTGGSQHPYATYHPPSLYENEWTREMIYLPGTTDAVIIFDRANVIKPFPESVPSIYNAATQANLHRWDALHPKILVQHTHTSPTVLGSVVSWTTSQSEVATYTVVYPTSFASTIYDETAANPGGAGIWNKVSAGEKKFHIKIYPTDDVLFNTFVTVAQVGTAGVSTGVEDAGKAQGVHLTRAGGADVLAVFNAEAGAALTPASWHVSHDDDLEVVRYRETGFTISWTASVAGSTLVLLNDLNPANSWTIAVDGGAPSTINAATLTANKGHYKATISGAGAHTIVIVGT